MVSNQLWIVSTKEGSRHKKLQSNYDYAMDSHHSWSSNSRWILFASKRDDGILTRLYLTEIDEEGHASPPVELPTLEDKKMCYNIPEFLKYRYLIDGDHIIKETTKRPRKLQNSKENGNRAPDSL